MSAENAPAIVAPAIASDAPKTRNKRPKQTFVLHCPETMQIIAKMNSADWRYAALKAATRINKLPPSTKNPDGSAKIWLRKTNTRVFREYNGNVVPLDTPQEVNRSGRVIVYTKRPVVTFVRSWVDGQDDAAKKESLSADVPTL